MLCGGPARFGSIAVLREALGTAKIAAVGAVGIIARQGAGRRWDLIGSGSHTVISVNLTLGKHKANRKNQLLGTQGTRAHGHM